MRKSNSNRNFVSTSYEKHFIAKRFIKLPIISNVIFNHSKSSFPSAMAEHRQDIPARKNVAQKIHFLPNFIMIKIANAMAGISTRPASAFKKNKKKKKFKKFWKKIFE